MRMAQMPHLHPLNDDDIDGATQFPYRMILSAHGAGNVGYNSLVKPVANAVKSLWWDTGSRHSSTVMVNAITGKIA